LQNLVITAILLLSEIPKQNCPRKLGTVDKMCIFSFRGVREDRRQFSADEARTRLVAVDQCRVTDCQTAIRFSS